VKERGVVDEGGPRRQGLPGGKVQVKSFTRKRVCSDFNQTVRAEERKQEGRKKRSVDREKAMTMTFTRRH